jgi:predicted site-specific integrase-resolvase
MVYRYISQGLIKSVDTPDGRRVTDEDAVAWITKYTAKRQAK